MAQPNNPPQANNAPLADIPYMIEYDEDFTREVHLFERHRRHIRNQDFLGGLAVVVHLLDRRPMTRRQLERAMGYRRRAKFVNVPLSWLIAEGEAVAVAVEIQDDGRPANVYGLVNTRSPREVLNPERLYGPYVRRIMLSVHHGRGPNYRVEGYPEWQPQPQGAPAGAGNGPIVVPPQGGNPPGPNAPANQPPPVPGPGGNVPNQPGLPVPVNLFPAVAPVVPPQGGNPPGPNAPANQPPPVPGLNPNAAGNVVGGNVPNQPGLPVPINLIPAVAPVVANAALPVQAVAPPGVGPPPQAVVPPSPSLWGRIRGMFVTP